MWGVGEEIEDSILTGAITKVNDATACCAQVIGILPGVEERDRGGGTAGCTREEKGLVF
jgi:hypothetical protein